MNLAPAHRVRPGEDGHSELLGVAVRSRAVTNSSRAYSHGASLAATVDIVERGHGTCYEAEPRLVMRHLQVEVRIR